MKRIKQFLFATIIFVLFGCSNTAPTKINSQLQSTVPSDTICKNEIPPRNYVIVGETYRQRCPPQPRSGMNAWVIKKAGREEYRMLGLASTRRLRVDWLRGLRELS